MSQNLPHSTGYYWAKTNGVKWWNAIIHVYGDFPFFRVDGWDFCKDCRVTKICDVDAFGNQIKKMD